MRIIKIITCWLFILCSSSFIGICCAQEVTSDTLRNVLERMEDRFSVNFTYMDKAIDSIRVNPPENTLSLQESLKYLENQIELIFVTLKDGYIAVKVPIGNAGFCGYLMDYESREPISDALVYAVEQYTTTDHNGYFELSNINPSVSIYARHLNYNTASLVFNHFDSECQTFYLSASLMSLDEVVIQNYITRGIDRKIGGKTDIDVQNTDILPGLTEPDVFFTLQTLPGIQSINETVTDINIRGGSNDQNLVLWDGVRLYQTGHFFGLISAINPHIVDKTSLIKNGTPSELGEGISGTIQVETKNNKASELTAEAGTNLINSDLHMEIPFKKTSLQVASRQSFSGIFITPTYRQYFDRAFRGSEVINDQGTSQVVNSDEQFSFYDLSANAIHEFSENAQVKAGFLNLDNSIKYEESAVVNSKLISRESRLGQGSLLGYLNYAQRWNDRFKTGLYASITNYSQQSINYDVLTGQEHILENEVLESAVKATGSLYINESWDFSAGFQWLETGIRNFREINIPEFRSLSKEVLRTTSFFVEANGNLFRNTSLVLGFRGNYFDKFDRFRLEPRLSVLQQLGGAFSMELLAETKSQTTVQVVDFQTDFLGVEKRKWELVNDDNIPLITSNQVSLGLNYQKKWLLMTLEGFYKEVDGIVTSSQGFLNQFQFIKSSGSYQSRGFEFLVNPRFEALNGWLSYSYLKSEYLFPDLNPPEFRNNFEISHSLSGGLGLKLKNLELSSGANFRSGRPFTNELGYNYDQERIIYDTPNTITLESYFRMDFSARYTLKISDRFHAVCGLAVWNLTNRKNIINSFYQFQNEGIERINQLAFGITPNINLRIVYHP